MNAREKRGRALAQDQRVRPIDGALWFVPSAMSGGYLVNAEAATCTCPDFAEHRARDGRCKHLWAVELVRATLPAPEAAAVALPAPLPRFPRGDLTPEEQAHAKAALRFLRIRQGGGPALAKVLRISPKTLTNGKGMSIKLVLRLARLAGVPFDDLISGRYPPPGACPCCGRA